MKILKTIAYIVVGLFVLMILIGIFAPAPKKTTPKYEIVSEEDVSYQGCKRGVYRVVMDDNSSDKDIQSVMQLVIDDKKVQWDNVTVNVFKNSEKDNAKNMGYTLGQKEYGTCE